MNRSRWLVYGAIAAGAICSAQTPQAQEPWTTSTTLPSVDFTGLSAPQKQKALQMLREQSCPCGCGLKVAECRFKDPGCGFSTGLASIVTKGLKDGKSVEEIAKLESASRWGHAPEPPKLLEDPVAISLAGAPSQGPMDARITLVEFSDFECPYCSQAANEVRAVLQAYPKDIRLVYKQFPLTTHPHANLAAVASLAALNQNKFWPMHDKLFGNFRKLSRDNFLTWAQELGLDMPRFTADLASPKLKTVVENDVKAGEAAGVNGTPSFFINGKHYNGSFSLAALKPIFEAELGLK
ncbi:MAG: thioredoxin domain-containing protein [Acidobacteriota bacterium]|nr:thioredoxin domain-containing protein [Acidobacteriota bacterium]